jgi:hypothetical protein
MMSSVTLTLTVGLTSRALFMSVAIFVLLTAILQHSEINVKQLLAIRPRRPNAALP